MSHINDMLNPSKLLSKLCYPQITYAIWEAYGLAHDDTEQPQAIWKSNVWRKGTISGQQKKTMSCGDRILKITTIGGGTVNSLLCDFYALNFDCDSYI